MNAAHNWKNVAFIWGGQLGNLQHPDMYDSILAKWETLEPLNYVIFSNDLHCKVLLSVILKLNFALE